MRLSRYTDIGLRALLYVGVREERVSAREVSDAFNVSRDHVTKSLQGLVSFGALTSAPGRNGGFTLDQDLRDIRLGQLIRKLEPSLALAECFTPHSTCPMTPSCELASALYEAQESFFDSLDQYSVADLIERDRPALIQLSYDRAS
jgi:Rrf2 family nitric oxide-sensitive transcriptional repressor